MLGIAIVMPLICLFWLGVNVFDGWVQRNIYPRIRLKFALLREKITGRHTANPTQQLGSARRIGKKNV